MIRSQRVLKVITPVIGVSRLSDAMTFGTLCELDLTQFDVIAII